MSEPIPECDDFANQFKEVKRLASADYIEARIFSLLIVSAHSAAEQCYQACADALSRGGTVQDRVTARLLSWPDIEERLRERHRALSGYARIAEGLPFAHWAGGKLTDHENKPRLSQLFDEKLNFLNDRHTIRDHVRISPSELLQNLEEKQLSLASSFHDESTAEDAIGRILAFHWDDISLWRALRREQEPNWWNFNGMDLPGSKKYSFETGRNIGYSIVSGHPKPFVATAIRLTLVRDKGAPNGFWVKTAFPSPV